MFVPDYMFDTVYDIPIDLFLDNGIKYLFFDIDNTLVPYEEELPTQENLLLFSKLEKAGIKIFFISNNHTERVKKYACGLGYTYEADAGKPSVKKYKAIIEKSGAKIEECACVGDQIFTDVVAASLLGVKSFLVKPIKDKKTWFFKTKRLLEKPFIHHYNRKNNGK